MSTVERKEWICPSCGTMYAIPARADNPSICPGCRSDRERAAKKNEERAAKKAAARQESTPPVVASPVAAVAKPAPELKELPPAKEKRTGFAYVLECVGFGGLLILGLAFFGLLVGVTDGMKTAKIVRENAQYEEEQAQQRAERDAKWKAEDERERKRAEKIAGDKLFANKEPPAVAAQSKKVEPDFFLGQNLKIKKWKNGEFSVAVRSPFEFEEVYKSHSLDDYLGMMEHEQTGAAIHLYPGEEVKIIDILGQHKMYRIRIMKSPDIGQVGKSGWVLPQQLKKSE